MDAELEHLRREVTLRRSHQEAAALRAELAGQLPDHPIEIAGTALPYRKRSASDVLANPAKTPRFGKEVEFSGESLEELQDYVNYWKTTFEHPSWTAFSWLIRVSTAAAYLRGRAISIWSNRDTTDSPETWPEYVEFLRSIVRAPANRTADAVRGIWRYHIKDNVSVRDVLDDLVSLRANIPPLTEEQRHAWELLFALKPEIRSEVQKELPEIESEEQVLRSAQRHEELLKSQNKGKSRDYAAVVKQPASSRTASSAPKRYTTTQPVKKAAVAPKRDYNDKPKGVCWNCLEPGHNAGACPKKAESKSAASATVAKRKEKSGQPKK